jgi:hypothetical protein
MIEHYWIISSMDTAPSEDGLTDVVKTVHWRRDAKEIDGDKTYYGDVYGAMGCAAPDPMAFKPYNELTFDEVCTWLEANLDMEALDSSLDMQIENQKNPPIVNLPLPWVPAAVQESTEETPSNSL